MRKTMKIPWWLHRTLLLAMTGFGFLAGAYYGLRLMSYISRLPGSAVPDALLVALLPIGAVVGGMLPQLVFRKWIHAKCPSDGDKMPIERVSIYPDGDQRRVGRQASRYRCNTCGLTK
jgi:hypothetical protein